ncbi:hypothetical protein HN011_008720 [Eciton burchellii]|nr:hypothetical protein HN011_008720 [Eciton burchellii]
MDTQDRSNWSNDSPVVRETKGFAEELTVLDLEEPGTQLSMIGTSVSSGDRAGIDDNGFCALIWISLARVIVGECPSRDEQRSSFPGGFDQVGDSEEKEPPKRTPISSPTLTRNFHRPGSPNL